jgi:molybdenum cofactor guanylyltransferase
MQNISISIAALVLAGGQSSRMGQDKALILWDGKPILQRVCAAAATCCAQVYILTPWQERYKHAIAIPNIHWLVENNPGQGAIAALAQGLNEIPTDWILLLACDLPLLEATILQAWAAQLEQLPADILALVPRQTHGWEPLCAFYRYAALPKLQSFIQQGGRSFQIWLSQIPVQPLVVSDREAYMLRNCNTPSDLHMP